LNLSILSPDELLGRDIVAVGYPARDYRSDLDLQDRIFHKVITSSACSRERCGIEPWCRVSRTA
jgi:hypothetical protein